MATINKIPTQDLISPDFSGFSKQYPLADGQLTLYLNTQGGNVNVQGGIYGSQIIQSYPIDISLQAYIKNIFDKLEKYINIEVNYVSNPDRADLNFYLDSTIDVGGTGTTLGITLENNQDQRHWWEIILNYPQLSSKIDYLSYAIIHEFGHALGLEHPFDGSDGDYFISLNSNNGAYPEDTVMAYRSPKGLGWPDWYSDNDMEALVTIWGAKQQFYSPLDDVIQCENFSEKIDAGAGNDTIICKSGSDELYGGAGIDTVKLDFTTKDILSAASTDDGQQVLLRTASEQKNLYGIENLEFVDLTVFSSDILSLIDNAMPYYTSGNTSSSYLQPTKYTGPVDYLSWQYLGGDSGDIVIGARTNDFMNLLGGDDAAKGAGGRDVLDGGTGSSFLTGGADADTFFVDGRNAVATWSTITDFNRTEGDTVNVWGWKDGVSHLVRTEAGGGAAGFTGATFHYDLDGNNQIDTSITFAGLTESQVGSPTAKIVAGNGYLFFG